MGNTTQDRLYDVFSSAAGSQAEALAPITSASDELADSLRVMVGHVKGGLTRDSANSNAAGSRSGASEALSIATTVMESGLGVIPLVTGLIGLFTGGGESAPAPLAKYAMPSKINFHSADNGDGTSDMDYDQMGAARAYHTAPASTSAATPQAAPQVTVNVSAMDSRSFLDHSSDIAQAVRDAMLNLSSINDVVSNL
jgi:hypothetical protein